MNDRARIVQLRGVVARFTIYWMRGVALVCVLSAGVASADLGVRVTDDLSAVEVELETMPEVPATTIQLASVPATRVLSYAEAGPPIAVAIVVQTTITQTVQSDFSEGEAWTMSGRIAQALARGHFETDLPAGSVGVVIGYSTDVRVIQPLGPIRGIGAGTLRDSDYHDAGSELGTAVERALAELDRSNAMRKAIIIIGDGSDTRDDAAAQRYRALRADAERKGVGIAAAIVRTAASGTGPIHELTANYHRYDGADVERCIADPIDALRARRFVYFPTTKLPRDGEAHDYEVTARGAPLGTVTIRLPRPPLHPRPWGWYLAIAGVLGAASLGWRRARR